MILYRDNLIPIATPHVTEREPATPVIAVPKKPSVPLSKDHLELLEWVTECAAQSKKCPTLLHIVCHFGIPWQHVKPMFNALEQAGLIQVFSARSSRTIYVNSTKQHTKPPVRNREWEGWIAKRGSHQ